MSSLDAQVHRINTFPKELQTKDLHLNLVMGATYEALDQLNRRYLAY